MAALEAFAPEHFGETQARHLLNRAGFGGRPDEVRALAEKGLDAAVDSLVNFHTIDVPPVRADAFDRDIVQPLSDDEREALRRARTERDEQAIERYRMRIEAQQRADRRQLAQMKQWWMRRFVESPRPLEEKLTLFWHSHFATAYRGIEDSYHLFLQNQLFRAHAAGNFADLCYGIIRDPAMLRYLNNDRNRRRAPNENLARELMELFTLGEGNGYTEDDIKEGARALTGYTFQDDDFIFRRDWHDSGLKRLFGETGTLDGDDFVRLILKQPAASQFICMKLYRYFVNDQPLPLKADAQAVVLEMARLLRRNGGELRPVFKALFRSRHFYEMRHVGGMIKSPVQLLVQTVRTLNLSASDIRPLVNQSARLGQNLFHPPSVKGWEVGRAWITTSTLFTRQNAVSALIRRAQVRGLVAADDTPATVAVRLLKTMLSTYPHVEQVEAVTSLIASRGNQINAATVRGAMLLIATMPEYQLC